MLNPLRWLFKLSADLAQKRGGVRDPWAYSYDASVDSRHYEAYGVVDGATFFIGNRKWPERWGDLSADGSRYASLVQADDGSYRLTVYERNEFEWRPWEGPSVVATLEDGQSLGRRLLARSDDLSEKGANAF